MTADMRAAGPGRGARPQGADGGADPTIVGDGAPAVAPLALGAADAARTVGVSRRHWLALCDSGRAPAGIRLGRRRIWSADELRRWVEHGCPPADQWRAMREARGGRA